MPWFRIVRLSVVIVGLVACDAHMSKETMLDAQTTDAATHDDASAQRDAAHDGSAASSDGITAFSSVDVTTLTDEELSVLDDAIGDASFVGLGEPLHTSGGIWAYKLRILRYLVERRGFRVLAWEAPHGLLRDNELAITRDCNTALGLASLQYGIWQAAEVEDVLQWICDYNAEHASEPVRLMGFDVQEPWSERDFVDRYVAIALPTMHDDLMTQIDARCAHVAETPRNINEGETGWYSFESDDQVAPCVDAIDGLRAALSSSARDVESRTTQSERDDGELAIDVLERTVTWQRGGDNPTIFQARDEAMAFVLQRQRELLTTVGGTVVWAANSHVSWRHEDIRDGGFTFETARSMGSFLREALGENRYRPIAVGAHRLRYLWSAAGVEEEVRAPASTQIIETLLDRRGISLGFINTALARSAGGALTGELNYRLYINGDFRPIEPERQFAGILFQDESRARTLPRSR